MTYSVSVVCATVSRVWRVDQNIYIIVTFYNDHHNFYYFLVNLGLETLGQTGRKYFPRGDCSYGMWVTEVILSKLQGKEPQPIKQAKTIAFKEHDSLHGSWLVDSEFQDSQEVSLKTTFSPLRQSLDYRDQAGLEFTESCQPLHPKCWD